ncbi:MAG TPA: hypothetical protein VFE13_17615 [Caulobacteraceae bacterium]|nr:hypothetical protein [Caulobacteraceae bacterium]
MPYATDLPSASMVAPRRPRPLVAAPIPPYPGLLDHDIFDPQRKSGAGVASAGTESAPLQVMGVVSSGRGAAALMKAPGAPAQFLRPGGAIGGWKLVSIGRDSVWIGRGDERRRLPVGASSEPWSSQPASPAAQPAEDSSQ